MFVRMSPWALFAGFERSDLIRDIWDIEELNGIRLPDG